MLELHDRPSMNEAQPRRDIAGEFWQRLEVVADDHPPIKSQ